MDEFLNYERYGADGVLIDLLFVLDPAEKALFFFISKVARDRRILIQSRRSGRMVEESMGSLGIDSRCLDIRVTTD